MQQVTPARKAGEEGGATGGEGTKADPVETDPATRERLLLHLLSLRVLDIRGGTWTVGGGKHLD